MFRTASTCRRLSSISCLMCPIKSELDGMFPQFLLSITIGIFEFTASAYLNGNTPRKPTSTGSFAFGGRKGPRRVLRFARSPGQWGVANLGLPAARRKSRLPGVLSCLPTTATPRRGARTTPQAKNSPARYAPFSTGSSTDA